MLLEPSEAAQALNVDEKTVIRWIKKDNLPAELHPGKLPDKPGGPAGMGNGAWHKG